MGNKHIPFTAFALISALTLSACGGSTEHSTETASNPEEGIFTFDSPRFGPAKSIHFQLPDSLKKAMGKEQEDLLVDSMDVVTIPLESSKYCAIQVTYNYTDGALDYLGKRKMPDIKAMALERMEYYLEDHPNGLVRDYDQLMNALEYEGYAKEMGFNKETYERDLERFKKEAQAEFDAQSQNPYDVLLERYNAKPASDFKPEQVDKEGRYLAEDLKTLTTVHKCAADPWDDSKHGDSLVFSEKAKKKDGTYSGDATYNFTAYVTSTTDGSLYINKTKIKGYQVDINGNWIQK